MEVGRLGPKPPSGRHTASGFRALLGRRARRRTTRAGMWWALLAVVMAISLAGAAQLSPLGSERKPRQAAGCTGQAPITTVAASPDQFPVMSRLATRWNTDAQRAAGPCARIVIHQAEPSRVAAALSGSWLEGRDGPRPDVWAPDSTVWISLATSRPEAASLLPAEAPAVAGSAIVLAVPRPMAEVLGWPQRKVRSTDLLGAMATGKTWADFGKPKWGGMRFGVTDPAQNTAGLQTLLTVLDRNGDNKLGNAEITAAVAFASVVTAAAPNTDALFAQAKAAGSAEQALPTAVIFPTDEYRLAAYQASGPALDLVPIYSPTETPFADHPYAILDAPWVDPAKVRTAERFRDFLLSADGQRAYGDAGFRDTAGTTRYAPTLSRELGFDQDLRPPTRRPDAGAMNQILAQWQVMQRPANVLIVLDTSGSMQDPIPQLGITRLQLLKQAAIKGIGLLNNNSRMGMWEFSTKLTPTTDHRELVPLGPASGRVGSTPRRAALAVAIRGLTANGGTGLYDTTAAAFKFMQQQWRPDAVNLVMVITDGRNEFDQGLNQAQLLDLLRRSGRPDRPTPVLGIAVGPAADAAALERISQLTGGRTFVARNESEVLDRIVLAFAGRLR